jgi:hypothetical protein
MSINWAARVSSQYVARLRSLPFLIEGEPFRTHAPDDSSFDTSRRAHRKMTSPFHIARLLREPGSERAIDINSMARRLQHREARLSAAQLVKPHPLVAEA